MCLCGTVVQYSYFVSPDPYQYRLQLSTDSKFCMQLGTPISMPTTRTPFIGRLYFIYKSIVQIISFQMMPPLRSFDDLDGKERGQKKTDDLIDGWLRMGLLPPPPPLGNFADISYLVEN